MYTLMFETTIHYFL